MALQRTILIILKGYPRLSETFIAQEIRALEQRGLSLRLASMRRPTDKAVHPVHREIKAPVSYLPEYLYQEPLRVLRAWWRVRRAPRYGEARRAWLKDWRRDPTPNRGRRFGQALVLAAELPEEVGHLHAHFLHTPASVTRYAALLTGLSWSCSAHAKDIWTTPDWEKREKLADADWAVTCTAAGRDHLQALAPPEKDVALVYHGLDLRRFDRGEAAGPATCGGDSAAPAIIASVGRAVSKKGYGDLLTALAALPPGLAWRFIHIGGGPLLPELKARAQQLGLSDRIEWRGAQPQEKVLDLYRQADLFVLASRIADDGDRDGLPNVLMEAQSQGVAVLATRLSGIPELIDDGATGMLVEAGDSGALARGLETLIRQPALRQRLGEAGYRRIRAQFDMEKGIDLLMDRFAPGRRLSQKAGI
ncbi:MAG TPA: glycosyltransferase family 4 protein [Verrucomicrobiae bacterium]|nr:glycosyltransferase family 4 protein [Verrucomicrobiae bacterium]